MPKNLAYEEDLLEEEIQDAYHGHETEEFDPLEGLIADGTILEVLGELKSGKEGTVYCCRGNPSKGFDLLAAKVFRAREELTFRNQSLYREGFVILNKHDQRALKKKTAWGRQVEYGTWMFHEYEVLRTLSRAGADVPEPVKLTDRVLLMEYIGDAETSAPKLQEIRLERDEVLAIFQRIMRNIELFLAHELIHADLSPYNVLYWQGDIAVIDFPQAVDPRSNRNAFRLLQRDIHNICRYFTRYGIQRDSDALTRSLWRRYMRAELY